MEGGMVHDGPANLIGPRYNDERFELLADDVAQDLAQLVLKLPHQVTAKGVGAPKVPVDSPPPP